jgi:hypothetical protein
MVQEVGVDVSSAVVSYRPAAGEERSLPLARAETSALYRASPWRTFRWYYGQKHYSGTYWSATMGDHVIYESRLELEILLLADFDPAVSGIVAQPFLLRAEVDGQTRRHIPDFLLETADGPVVIDVVRTTRLSNARIIQLLSWTEQLAVAQGWMYRVASETPRPLLANVRFLAGYRRARFINEHIVNEIRSGKANLVGLPIAEAERRFWANPRPLVRAAILHLLWRQELSVDVAQLLRPTTIIEGSK